MRCSKNFIVMEYNFSFYQLIYFLLFIVVFIIALIILFKRKLKQSNDFGHNVFMFRRSFLMLGFIIALASVFVIFNVTTGESKTMVYIDNFAEDIIDIDIPATKQQKKKELPKPPPPIIETVPEEDLTDEPVEFLPMDTDENDSIEIYEYDTIATSHVSLPPPPKMEEDNDEVISLVEKMPRFPGCEDKPNNEEKEKCSLYKLMQYIYKNLKYPAIARESSIEGRVVVRFIVDKKGKISNVQIMRDIGGGCGEAAAKVIKDMNNLPQSWIPGQQGGHKVRVYYTLPILFRLKG